MKQNLFTVLLVSCASLVFGQYLPNNAQAFQFMPMFNPAFTGVERFDDLKFSYRYQWSGFGENAPKFINLGFTTRVKQPLDLAFNALRMSDASAMRADHLPRSKRMIHGLGINIFQSSIGVLNSIGANVGYAIHYPLANGVRFAGGAGAFIENRKMDVRSIALREPDAFYDHLLTSSTSQTDLNIRAGVVLYAEKFYLGASYLPLVYTVLQSSELAMDEPFYRATFQGGVAFSVNPDLTLKPGIMALLPVNRGPAIDYGVKAYIQDKIWLGFTYRDIKSGIAMFGFNFNKIFTASYSYEMSLGDFREFNDGSHELVLAARFRNVKKFNSYLW